MNDPIKITDEDRANIEKFVGRELSSITRDEEGVLEDLINRGLIGIPRAADGTNYVVGQSLLPQEA